MKAQRYLALFLLVGNIIFCVANLSAFIYTQHWFNGLVIPITVLGGFAALDIYLRRRKNA